MVRGGVGIGRRRGSEGYRRKPKQYYAIMYMVCVVFEALPAPLVLGAMDGEQ
jgi:hypothetical protein